MFDSFQGLFYHYLTSSMYFFCIYFENAMIGISGSCSDIVRSFIPFVKKVCRKREINSLVQRMLVKMLFGNSWNLWSTYWSTKTQHKEVFSLFSFS
jgi:hypothetical protein